MRSGNRPADDTAATDKSAAAAEVTSNVEDTDAAGPPTAVPATGEGAGEHRGAPGETLGEPGGNSQESSQADAGTGGRSQRPGRSGSGIEAARLARVGAALRQPARERRAGVVTSWPPAAAGLAWLRRPRPRGDRTTYSGAAEAWFARLTVLPAILVMAWLVVGLPLLLARVFLPAPSLLISVPVAVVLAAGLREVPVRWPGPLSQSAAGPGSAQAPGDGKGPARGWPAWCGLAGTIAVAAGFAAWQLWFNAETVIVLRSPGAYLQTGYWIAQHGSLPIPITLAAFGGAHPGLGFSSTGFLVAGSAVVPGLMTGLPLLLAAGFWIHGTTAAAAMGPILGGLAVLAFGGLAGRLAGPQWAPAGALALSLTLPEQYTSRGSFSEIAAQLLLFGGLSLVADALTLGYPGTARGARPGQEAPAAQTPGSPATGWRRWLRHVTPSRRVGQQRALMALGGLAIGLTTVIRADGLLFVLPAIPFAGVLFARRSRTALAFSIGLGIGAGYGLADGYLLARPFLASLQPVPELIGLAAALLAALTLAAVELLRLPGFRRGVRRLLASRRVRWLPNVGAGLAVAALIGLLVRPYVQTVRGRATGAAADYVASLQRLEHLPVDPGRLYAEDTLYWVIWYVGLPALLLGGFGAALLIRQCLRALFTWRDPSGTVRVWALPLAVICSASAGVLWQPHTVPDQPWASRRLVPVVLPGLIICAVWASAWLRGRARSRGAGRTAGSLVAACCVAALLVPTAVTTFGLGLTHSGRGGALRPTANGLSLQRAGQGQVPAVTRLCSSLGPAAAVVIVDRQVAAQFSQVIRGMCGDPAAWMIGQPSGAVQAVLSGMERTGRRPILLGARPAELYSLGGSPVRVVNLSTTQDPHTLTQPPSTLWTAHYTIWMSALGSVGARV